MMIEHIHSMKDLKKNILRREVHIVYIPQICLQMKKLKRKIKASKLNPQMILEISILKNINEFIYYIILQNPLWIHSIITPSKNWIKGIICSEVSLIYNLVNKKLLTFEIFFLFNFFFLFVFCFSG
jgi:hypothetical protein